MQIILTQDEIDTALRETILSQITIREDQKIHIRIEGTDDGGHIAVIDVLKADEEPQGGGSTGGGTKGNTKPAEAPKPRTRRSAAQIAADNAAEADKLVGKTADTVIVDEVEAVTGEQTETDETVADTDPPFDVEQPVTQEEPAAETVQAEPVQHNVSRIFPDAGTSAPAMQPKDSPVVAAKSLFANLTKPTNGSGH